MEKRPPIGKYDYREDKEYKDHLEKEKREGGHFSIYDDYANNPNVDEEGNEK